MFSNLNFPRKEDEKTLIPSEMKTAKDSISHFSFPHRIVVIEWGKNGGRVA